MSPLFATAAPTGAGYREITPAALSTALGTIRVVDVREHDELAGELRPLEGIEHAPLATVAERAARWPQDEAIVLVCRSGARSGRAARLLVDAGFRQVLNLTGGMLAYHAAGLPRHAR